MADALLSLTGVSGQLYLYPTKVVISRKGVLAKLNQGFFKGDKEILIRQISGIQFKLGTHLTNGYIQFTLPGGNESIRGIAAATKDENSVFFSRKENEVAKTIKEKIEELQENMNHPQTPNIISSADEIRKLKELFDDGIITQDEFTKKKAILLEKM